MAAFMDGQLEKCTPHVHGTRSVKPEIFVSASVDTRKVLVSDRGRAANCSEPNVVLNNRLLWKHS